MSPKARFRKFISRWLRRRFYNRMFLLNASIFIIVVYAFCFIASSLVANMETGARLQRNREALSAVCDEYDRKHNNFYNIILPLYTSSDNANTLSKLLGSGEPDWSGDAFFKQRVVDMMRWLTVQDRDIIAVLIHRKSDGADFVYSEKYRSFGAAPQDYPFFADLRNKPPYGRSIYGVRVWGAAGQQQQAYGIAGTIGTKDIYNYAGSIMVAYDVSGLHRAFQQYAATASGRFLIVTKDGDVVFDSARELYGSRFDRMDLVKDNGKTALIDGVKYAVQVLDYSNRNYYGISIEASAVIGAQASRYRLLIFTVGTGISFLSALLYFIAGLLSTRRVAELERAMGHVGSNNLDYRVPVRGRGDEFEHIAIRFNQMCDELQDNINKLYVNEIKQKSAELNALQSGINPHFLYNTLEAIRSKAREDGNDDVAEFIVMMASLLRNLVRSQMFIPVRQEIDFCRMYLNMFALRYAESFEYAADIDPAALDFGLPKGILQPVLENYFVHGIREDRADNYLSISGELSGGFITFTVRDNGKGIEPSRLNELNARLAMLDTSHSTYGIANVNERIKLVFGAESGLTLESGEGGAAVRVRVRAMTCAQLEQSIQVIKQREKETG